MFSITIRLDLHKADTSYKYNILLAPSRLSPSVSTEMMTCRKQGWHRRSECENTEVEEASRFRKLKSDLFNKRGVDVPAAQKKIMNHNSASNFFRIPAELRVRIYRLVLGDQQLWIGLRRDLNEWVWRSSGGQSERVHDRESLHFRGTFYHVKGISRSDPTLHLGLLRVCRQIFTETALLPYTFNNFTFESDEVRKAFERMARPGKKRVQKKAVGSYEIGTLDAFHRTENAKQGILEAGVL